MLLKELREGTDIHYGIEQHLKKLGYKFLGAGVDQQAWLAKDGSVIKIFGTHGKKLTDSHKMFFEWKKFCDKWKGRTHLVPHHIQYSKFMYEGNAYLQIRMERLFKLTPEIERYIEEYVDMARIAKSKEDFMDAVAHLASNKFSSWQADGMTSSTGAIQDIGDFYVIIKELSRAADRNDWQFDLHDGNLMLDDEGYLVIVDPWHVPEDDRDYYW